MGESERPVLRPGRDAEITEFVAARMTALRRMAYLLCQDWHRADDLVQVSITKLYANWHRASVMDHTEAYVRTILVREYISERRSGWARRVSLDGGVPELACPQPDRDAMLDMNAALAGLPPRQRATIVLRFYCDLTVDQVADVLGCTPGTVKSQTAKGLSALKLALERPESNGADAVGRRRERAPAPARSAAMDENTVRSLLHQIAGSAGPPCSVDVGRARRAGLRRVLLRRIGAPAASVSAVVVVAGLVASGAVPLGAGSPSSAQPTVRLTAAETAELTNSATVTRAAAKINNALGVLIQRCMASKGSTYHPSFTSPAKPGYPGLGYPGLAGCRKPRSAWPRARPTVMDSSRPAVAQGVREKRDTASLQAGTAFWLWLAGARTARISRCLMECGGASPPADARVKPSGGSTGRLLTGFWLPRVTMS